MKHQHPITCSVQIKALCKVTTFVVVDTDIWKTSFEGKLNVWKLVICVKMTSAFQKYLLYCIFILYLFSNSLNMYYILRFHLRAGERGRAQWTFLFFWEMLNKYIYMPKNTGFAYELIHKTHGYNCILFFKKFVLTSVTLVINFYVTLLAGSATPLRWFYLLKMAVLCWKFNWGLLHYAYS